MVLFVKEEFLPNAAETNRLFAFIKGSVSLGRQLSMIYVNECPYKDIYGVTVESPIGNSKNKYIQKVIGPFQLYKRLKKLNSDDTIVFFSAMLVMMVPVLLKNHIKAKMFYECTENPEVIRPNTLFYRLYRRLLFKCCKKLDGMFVISTSLKQYFVRKGVSEDRIHIVNMIVDTQRFEGVEKQAVDNPYVAYCGTATNNKDGVDELIKAFAIVSRKYPNYKLYIIGKGITKGDDSGNYRLVESLHLLDKVVFTGIVPSEEIPQILKNANILALDRPDNKQAKYGFPTKLGEYLLTENPVVVTRVGDIPLFLRDGESAMIAEPGSPESFSTKLIWLIEHPKEAKEIGIKGAKVAIQSFNAINETEKLYEGITCNR